MFFCPKCKALYCETCAKALSQLENACWSCNNIIDEARPQRLDKEEEKVKNGIIEKELAHKSK